MNLINAIASMAYAQNVVDPGEDEDKLKAIIQLTIETACACAPLSMQSDVVTAHVSRWDYSMRTAPAGQRCLLLNAGGVACLGPAPKYDPTNFFKAWAPLPRRDKELEKSLGILL